MGETSTGSELTDAGRRLAEAAMKTYQTTSARSALRCGIGDAAAIVDAAVRLQGKQRRSQQRAAIIDALRHVGDAIWAMRERVKVNG